MQQLLDDLRKYFEFKSLPSEAERALLHRLKEDIFPILFLQKDDLARTGFDVGRITSQQMHRLAQAIAEDYCQSETSAGANFWEELELIAKTLELPRNPKCPICGNHRSVFNMESGTFRCEICDQIWHKSMYVLVEFPDDTSYFEDNDIGYPSFESQDNGARYVSEYNYILHFQKTPAENACYKPLRWSESQPHLFPDEPNESAHALCKPMWDEKSIADFGEQAVWVPLCNLKN